MTTRFWIGLVMIVPALPVLTVQLARRGAPTPPRRPVARPSAARRVDRVHAPIVTAVAVLPEQRAAAAVPFVEGRPPDPVPDVTPPMAKAGGVRRAVLAPPCHECSCCRVYATRQAAAHREIDQLRDELVHADGRRINAGRPQLASAGALIPFADGEVGRG